MSADFYLTVHSLVANEQQWIWYALNSVLPWADKLQVWDTGSRDSTQKIIASINSPKLHYRRLPEVMEETHHSQIRTQMLRGVHYGWLMVLDGDEIWPSASLFQIHQFITDYGTNYESIIVPTLNLVGDVYHRLPDSAGHYHFAAKTGHYALRFFNLNRLGQLKVVNPKDGLQSFVDSKGWPIQDRDSDKQAFVNAPYFHTTHLRRSTYDLDRLVYDRKRKYKFELGQKITADISYPASFYLPRPSFVPSPWSRRSPSFLFTALWQTPLKWLRRQLLP